MRKLTLLIPLALVLGLTACEESYDAVNGTEQVLVRDADAKIDGENIRKACEDKGQRVARVQWVGNGKLAALVTCR